MVHVLVVSPLPMVRAGLRALLDAAEDYQVVGEAEALAAVDRAALQVAPDVVVLDAQPDLELNEVDWIIASETGPGLVILGPRGPAEQLLRSQAGRPWSYLALDATGEQIVAAVRATASGLVAIDRRMAGGLLERAEPPASPVTGEQGEELTAREQEVLQLVALGLANKTIAHRLGISEHTVKFHVAAILAKLGAGSRTEAAHLGARRGLVTL